MPLRIIIECPEYENCIGECDGLPISDCIECLRHSCELEEEERGYQDRIIVREMEKKRRD